MGYRWLSRFIRREHFAGTSVRAMVYAPYFGSVKVARLGIPLLNEVGLISV